MNYLAVLPLIVGLLVTDASAQRRREKLDWQAPTLGIAITIPGAWTQVPRREDTPWIAASFVDDGPDPRFGHTFARVIVLPADVDRVREIASPDPLDPYSLSTEGSGHATYEKFVEATTPDIVPNGKEFRVEETATGDSPIGEYRDYRVIEQPGDGYTRRARVFEREAHSIAVELTAQTVQRAALESLWQNVVEKTRQIAQRPRRPSPDDRWLGAKLQPEHFAAWLALPASKRKSLRKRFETAWAKALKKQTGPAWEYDRTKRLVVISQRGSSPDPFVADLEVFLDYLDDLLGDLSDEHVRRSSLRICRAIDQGRAFCNWHAPTSGFGEAVITDTGIVDPIVYGRACETLFYGYLHDKNALVGHALPSWLRHGLHRTLYYAARIEQDVTFDGSDFARDHGREIVRQRKLTPLRQIFTLDGQEFTAWANRLHRRKERWDVQCQLAVSFLLSKTRTPALENFLPRYLSALAKFAAELPAADDRAAFLDQVHAQTLERVIGSDDATWKKIEREYAAFLRG